MVIIKSSLDRHCHLKSSWLGLGGKDPKNPLNPRCPSLELPPLSPAQDSLPKSISSPGFLAQIHLQPKIPCPNPSPAQNSLPKSISSPGLPPDLPPLPGTTCSQHQHPEYPKFCWSELESHPGRSSPLGWSRRLRSIPSFLPHGQGDAFPNSRRTSPKEGICSPPLDFLTQEFSCSLPGKPPRALSLKGEEKKNERNYLMVHLLYMKSYSWSYRGLWGL